MIPDRPDETLAEVVPIRRPAPHEPAIDVPLGDRGPASATLVVPDMDGATVLRGRHRRHVARGPALAARIRATAWLLELLDARDRRHVDVARSALGRRRPR